MDQLSVLSINPQQQLVNNDPDTVCQRGVQVEQNLAAFWSRRRRTRGSGRNQAGNSGPMGNHFPWTTTSGSPFSLTMCISDPFCYWPVVCFLLPKLSLVFHPVMYRKAILQCHFVRADRLLQYLLVKRAYAPVFLVLWFFTNCALLCELSCLCKRFWESD